MSKNTKLFADWKKYVKDLKKVQPLNENMYNEMSHDDENTESMTSTVSTDETAMMDEMGTISKDDLNNLNAPLEPEENKPQSKEDQSWEKIKPNDLQNAVLSLKGYLMTKNAPDQVWDAYLAFMQAAKAAGFK